VFHLQVAAMVVEKGSLPTTNVAAIVELVAHLSALSNELACVVCRQRSLKKSKNSFGFFHSLLLHLSQIVVHMLG
jgi:cytochrome c-type biogenesis protein CcmH/NrfF